MSNDNNTSHNKAGSELQGSILRGILGSVAGMIVCILVMLLCSLFQMGSFSTMLQLLAGLVIGWFYRLFHGRRSKTAAYVTVGICTVSASILWVVLLAMLSAFASPALFTAADWGRMWGKIWELLILCAGLGMIGAVAISFNDTRYSINRNTVLDDIVCIWLNATVPAGLCRLEKRPLAYGIRRGEWVFLQPAPGKTSRCQPADVLCRTQPLCTGNPDHGGWQQPPVAETAPQRPGVFRP